MSREDYRNVNRRNFLGKVAIIGAVSSGQSFPGNRTIGFSQVFQKPKYTVEWSRKYLGRGDDSIYSILETEDGYIFSGSSKSFFTEEYDAWLVKVDKDGEKVWGKNYGGKKTDYPASGLIEVEDGYLFPGYTKSFGSQGFNGWLVKTDKKGEKLWQANYEGLGYSLISSLTETENGYLMVGSTKASESDVSDAWLLKVDKKGETEWQRKIGGRESDWAQSVIRVSEGYVFLGYTNSFRSGVQNTWLVKVDEEGDKSWQRVFSSREPDYPIDLIKTQEGYLFTGSNLTRGYNQNGWVVNTDEKGNKLWEKMYNRKSASTINSVTTVDDGYVLAGNKELIKITTEGREEWGIKYSESNTYTTSMTKTADGYILAGESKEGRPGSSSGWLMKLGIGENRNQDLSEKKDKNRITKREEKDGSEKDSDNADRNNSVNPDSNPGSDPNRSDTGNRNKKTGSNSEPQSGFGLISVGAGIGILSFYRYLLLKKDEEE